MVNYIKKILFNLRKKREIKRLCNELKTGCDRIYKEYSPPLSLCLSANMVQRYVERIEAVQRTTFNQDLGVNSTTVRPFMKAEDKTESKEAI